MNRQTSINLDLVRWLAAFMVFAYHLSYNAPGGLDQHWLEPMGHLGVMVFFVLSGYVIRFVADGHHKGPRDYLEARWARINSVFLPVLVATVVLDLIGARFAPELYARFPDIDAAHLVGYTPFFITFLYQNSVHEMRWFSNGPLWSIAYEVWYYIVFWAFFYFRGRVRLILTGLSLLLAGYQILLLMPLWLSGCLVYKQREATDRLPLWLRRLSCVLSLALIVFLCTPVGHAILDPLRAFGQQVAGPGYHATFLADYVLCLPMMLFIATLCSNRAFCVPAAMVPFIRWNTGFSFTLYAFHLPLILVLVAVGLLDFTRPWRAVLTTLLVIATCWLLSLVTEQRKKEWRALARWGSEILLRIAAGLRRRAARTA
ncbi:MAG TPA: acyltransferase [Novosphingobium sp.]|nr:acyltransferase [Novosphingobium sp.]